MNTTLTIDGQLDNDEDSIRGRGVREAPGAKQARQPLHNGKAADDSSPRSVTFAQSLDDLGRDLPRGRELTAGSHVEDKQLEYNDTYRDSGGQAPLTEGFKPPIWHSSEFPEFQAAWPAGLGQGLYDHFYKDPNGLRVGEEGFEAPGRDKPFGRRQYDKNFVDPNGRQPMQKGFLPPWWLDEAGHLLAGKDPAGYPWTRHDPFNYSSRMGSLIPKRWRAKLQEPRIRVLLGSVAVLMVSLLLGLMAWRMAHPGLKH